MLKEYLITAFLSLLPVSELRGAIPYAFAVGIPLPVAYFYCVFFNALVGPIAFIFLTFFHKLFYKWKFYANLFDKLVTRARNKVHVYVEKYGLFGIYCFVAIPFPLTGAWTGTLGAWILGLSKRKTLLSVLFGVITSGLIVSLIIGLGLGISIFVKQL